jgi:NADPH2:quinone reductase
MHALTFSRFGGPEVLEWTAVPDPFATPGVAVVRMQAIGLNFADVYRRQGRYHLAGAPPWIAGYEGAGEIVALHADDTRGDAGRAFRVGQRVAFADSPFANAERVAVPLDKLIALPDDIGADTAAALLLQGLTAQFLLEDSHAVGAGETLLVHAAGGGVGQLLVQLAHAQGARVIALASSADKRAAALAPTAWTWSTTRSGARSATASRSRAPAGPWCSTAWPPATPIRSIRAC